jgi:hypothetical protein
MNPPFPLRTDTAFSVGSFLVSVPPHAGRESERGIHSGADTLSKFTTTTPLLQH